MLSLVDLCAGTGAFSTSFLKSGKVRLVYANDMDKYSKVLFDQNHDVKMELGDICQIDVNDIPKHDILCAGFPCQPFSIAGKLEGFGDPRSNVFWSIISIIKQHKPKIVFLENVKNLLSHDNGNTIKTIIYSLEQLGYLVQYKLINTADVTDIPQNRERVYIIATREEIKINWPSKFTKQIQYKNILEQNVDIKYYYSDKYKCFPVLSEKINKRGVFYQYRRYYVRENKTGLCPTLTANMGTGGHNVPLILDNEGIRKLTPRECFNLQGFPPEFNISNISDSHLYKLAGNAVSLPVIDILSKQLV